MELTVIEIRIDNPKNIKELDLFLLPFGTRDPYPVINAPAAYIPAGDTI
jgi:hypothetical protein